MSFSDPKITKLYRDVQEESLRSLLGFRERWPYRTMMIHGRQWRYIDTGEGEKVLLVLAGGTTVAEVSFNSLTHFAQRYRVIAPDYPPIGSMRELIDGCVGLLDRLGLDTVYAMGGSYGGWVVQSLVRQYPQRVEKVLITVAGPPDPENSRSIAKKMRWLRMVPTFVLRAMLNRAFSRLDTTKTDDPDMALLWALVREVMNHRVQRDDIMAALERIVDQTESMTFSPNDLEDWPGKMLVVFGSEDPATPPEKRDAMATLYPRAEIKIIEGGEHGIGLTHGDEYYATIDGFLAR